MFGNYFKIAWRTLFKNPQFTFLNLIGLSTGLACFLLIYLWVYDERNFDHFHENGHQLFQVMENTVDARGINTSNETSGLLADALTQTMPEIEYATVSTPPSWFSEVTLTVGEKPVSAAGLFAGKDYFNVFSYQIVQGNKATVLADKNGIVISEKLAMMLFNTTQNVIGKTINWQIYEFKKTGIITGVFKGTPANSSTQFDFALSFDAFKELMNITGSLDSQNSTGPFMTYVVLKNGTNITNFNARLSDFMKSKSQGNTRHLFLQPYTENYLYGKYENGKQVGGRIGYVKLFSLIAVLILILACINFMNLSTAKAAGRMKEIGIRKSMGARRKTLIFQYLGETMLLVFLALIIAFLFIILLLPAYNDITGKQITLHPDLRLILAILAITIITGLFAGSYPAFYLSGLNPLEILKGKIHKGIGQMRARNGLVVFQFTISVLFLIAVLIIYRQLNYIQTKNPGYDKDHVIYWNAEGKVPADLPGFLAEIKKIPDVVNASAMVGNVISTGPGLPTKWKDQLISFNALQGTYDIIETLGIQMVSGHSFSRNSNDKIIFNEAAIKAMGIENPVGKIIDFSGRKLQITGVTKDFHYQSLHEKVKPLFFMLDPLSGTIMVRIKAGTEHKVIDRLKTFYQSYNPDFNFNYNFLDANYQAQYVSEKRMATLTKYFAGLAMLISCLGLLGLTSFTIEKRSREISIRKVLGATSNNIVLMLSKTYLLFVLIAACLAIPVGWWTMNKWLQGFAYHIPMGADVFLIALGIVFSIALLSTGFMAIKAAWANPVTGLRTE